MDFKQIECLPNYEISESCIIRDKRNGRIKSQYIGSTGYYMVSISTKNKTNPYRAHRLLMQTFVPNPNGYKEVNHIDGNKLNNDLKNLEWCDHKQNMSHAFKAGLANNSGEKNGMAKLRDADIPVIRQFLENGLSQYKIAKMFNVSRSAIMNLKNRSKWGL
jgi:hypothetical protein